MSAYFYQKCLEIAELLDDVDLKIEATSQLGMAHQKLGNCRQSVVFHEQQLQLASSCPEKHLVLAAEKALFKAYVDLAGDLKHSEAKGEGSHVSQAVEVLRKCLGLPTIDMEEIEHAAVFLKLGELLVLCDASQAVEPLEKYLNFCKGKQLVTEEGRACAALAAAYEKLGKLDESAEQLNAAMVIAHDTGDLRFQARTAKRLGAVYTLQKDHENAVRSFEANHGLSERLLAREQEGEIGSTNAVEGLDTARLLVGISRANSLEDDYMDLVKTDLSRLLACRNKREMVAN